MKTSMVSVLAVLAVAGAASARVDTVLPAPTLLQHAATPAQWQQTVTPRAGAGAVYSNIDGATYLSAANGGATAGANGSFITQLIADDVTPFGGAGGSVTEFTFGVSNQNAVAVLVRPRVRFWFANGAGGAPGTYYNLPANIGFTFAPISILPGQNAFSSPVAPGTFTVPGGTVWAGWTFDTVNAAGTGSTGVTQAELNNVGQLYGNAPTIGTSADRLWLSNAAGSFFGVANPAGTVFASPFSGNPLGNQFFELIPSPSSMALLGLGGLMAARRRRN